MKWRIGNFYYSSLREQWVHAYLRSHGVMTRQHPLADALFAVDGWADDKVISLYIGNQDYRTESGGRKHGPQDHLRGALPPFTFIDMELRPADKFGEVYLPRRQRSTPGSDATSIVMQRQPDDGGASGLAEGLKAAGASGQLTNLILCSHSAPTVRSTMRKARYR